MNNLLCLAILLVAPISVFADCALQEMGYVVEDREINDLRACNATSVVSIPTASGDRVRVVFTCETANDPDDVYDNITDYMSGAVGDAESSFEYDEYTQTISVTYESDYCPNMKKPSKMQSLVRVLRDYPSPQLGTHVCQQNCFETKAGFSVIGITIPCKGKNYRTCCDDVFNYLKSGKYLDNNVNQQCCRLSCGSAHLQLWDVPSNCLACN